MIALVWELGGSGVGGWGVDAKTQGDCEVMEMLYNLIQGGYMSVDICQNILYCILKMCAFYCT